MTARQRAVPVLAPIAAVAALAAIAGAAAASEALPPAPARWVSDRAGVLSSAAAARIDAKLEAFEKQQGTQVLVAIFRRLPADEALEDWTQRVAESWRVGRARQDDGAVLFVFVDDRQLRLEVGYGLEGALTDLESKGILDDVLVPRLREGDWDGGIDAATDAILAAVRGEFTPDAAPRSRSGSSPGFAPFLIFLIVVIVINLLARFARRSGFGGGGGFRGGGWPGGGFGGGGFSGGGFGGGGFSGGGGSFGGGGASGRW